MSRKKHPLVFLVGCIMPQLCPCPTPQYWQGAGQECCQGYPESFWGIFEQFVQPEEPTHLQHCFTGFSRVYHISSNCLEQAVPLCHRCGLNLLPSGLCTRVCAECEQQTELTCALL